MYMYIHVCMCVHVCTCTCKYVCTCMYMYVCSCLYVGMYVHCMYACMYVHVCTCTYIYLWYARTSCPDNIDLLFLTLILGLSDNRLSRYCLAIAITIITNYVSR